MYYLCNKYVSLLLYILSLIKKKKRYYDKSQKLYKIIYEN